MEREYTQVARRDKHPWEECGKEAAVQVASTGCHGGHHDVLTGCCGGQELQRALGMEEAHHSQGQAGAHAPQTKHPRDNKKAAGPVHNGVVGLSVKHLAVQNQRGRDQEQQGQHSPQHCVNESPVER